MAALAVLMAATAGCGGGSSAPAGGTVVKALPLYPWLKGPSRQFLVPGGDNIVPTFGREGTLAERRRASEVIAGWMRAREAQAWGKDCSYLSRAYRENITEDAHGVSSGKVKTCSQALAYFGHQASGDYVDNLSGPIDSLRVGDGRGYAQYHGSDGKDWVVPVERDDGSWKVSIAAPLERNK